MSVSVGHRLGALAVAVAVLSCSANDSPSAQPGGGSGGTPAQGGSSGASGSATGGAAGQASSGGSAGSSTGGAAGNASFGGAAGTTSTGLGTLGSFVVLGDSISDGGGVSPFYYDLLHGDLAQKYGAIQYKNNAQSGSKTSALKSQIDALPSTLAGPVAVCITSGGNDMKAELPAIITNTDGPARAAMGANIATALEALLAPDRFGAGIAVYVFEADIYDSSDGQGNFGTNGCAFGKGLPAIPTDTFFANWNGEIQNQVQAKGQAVADIHQLFWMHGFNHPPDWYASDCTHPNQTGHDQLRRYFYQEITGETLP